MVKGGKRQFSPMRNDGKWFAHPVSPENETRNRETCTSTGIMLTQVKSAPRQAFNFERYPKWKSQQESRDFPLSEHDNKHSLKDSISLFTHGVGRRKCPDDRSQLNTNFCFCHDGADNGLEETRRNISVSQIDFMERRAVDAPTSNRRFPRNHQQKSAEAALAQRGERFMWFGRHDSHPLEPLEVLAATNHSAPSSHKALLKLRR
ncbi:testis-expressed protein 36 [Sparus aurata]|uniref:testis-expressed protein 36 n=1 Tax=Sparus aurata TaxID=8175 RepID=UPI0011C0F047|nr:testis-expressed protein 36 [Sparus aurata]